MELRNDSSPKITRHAAARMRQRGYKGKDIALVRAYGTPVAVGFLMTRDDMKFARVDAGVSHQQLERLIGTALIEQEGALITLYRPRKRQWRRLMKNRCC